MSFILNHFFKTLSLLLYLFIFLTRDFSWELYVLPDDDKRYAIETCRSIDDIKLVHLLVVR